MRTINQSLRKADDALLPILARVWDVDIEDMMDSGEMIDAISKAMLDHTRAERVWTTLDDAQRGALFMLIGSGAKMLTPKFERLFGEIRPMGTARIERERPDLNPASIAEALYYKGLIAQGYESAETGARSVVFLPDDLLAALPTHKTAYETLDEEEDVFPVDDDEAEIEIEVVTDVKQVRAADTSIVDDLTTLLAYVRIHGPTLEIDPAMQSLSDYQLSDRDRERLMPHLLTKGDDRLTFLLGVALSAELIEVQSGRAYTRGAEIPRWLGATRAEQVRALAEAWQTGRAYRDLWHVPGLYPEPGGALDSYDPAVIRQSVMEFMADLAPKSAWWSLESFISTVKETDPDFQRPGGDYDTWYIRNDANEYLQGFESWDAVEGALLEFYVVGPMHWLGLVDLAEDAARLTAYGRAFLGLDPWPAPPEASDKIMASEDGTLSVSRKVSRIDRYQIARFTSWGQAGDPYLYKLDARGITQAAAQNISTDKIGSFLARTLGEAAVPQAMTRLLMSWQSGPSTRVTMERLLVLRTTAPETLDAILETPALRRYLGARLGPMAAIVRADQYEALQEALGEQGIQVELME